MDQTGCDACTDCAVDLALWPQAVEAAPTAEFAKRCLHYTYIVYPYKRPGAVRMSGDREAWFRDCLAKNGEVPQPDGGAKPQASVPAAIPASGVNSGDSSPPAQTSH